MGVMLISMRGMPEDEYAEICQLLESNGIDFYVVPPSNWFISGGGIWLTDGEQLGSARQLLDAYELERAKLARAEYQQRSKSQIQSLLVKFLENPVQFIIYTAIAIFVVYISLKPFFDIGR